MYAIILYIARVLWKTQYAQMYADYSYFIPMPSSIIPVIFFKFLLCSDNEIHNLFS